MRFPVVVIFVLLLGLGSTRVQADEPPPGSPPKPPADPPGLPAAEQSPADPIGKDLPTGAKATGPAKPEPSGKPAPEAAEPEPRTSAEFYQRGLKRMNNNRSDEGLADFDKAIELDPENADAYAERGDWLRILNRGDRGKADLDKAIALNPRHPNAFCYRASYHYAMDDYETRDGRRQQGRRGQSHPGGRLQHACDLCRRAEELYRGPQGFHQGDRTGAQQSHASQQPRGNLVPHVRV